MRLASKQTPVVMVPMPGASTPLSARIVLASLSEAPDALEDEGDEEEEDAWSPA